uniref:Uncharacterized protein n=1 Tax=Hucho hucho TaxID=62062 RepID=A0A4W5QHF1_9TELE
MSDQSTDSLKNEWEKKLHTAVAGMEQEKFELQKKQTENIQELLEDTNQRLAKMEAEYGAQTQATASDVIEDLEQTVTQLRQQLQDSEHRRLKQLRVNCLCVRERENGFIPQELEEVQNTIQMCVQR